MAWPPEATMSQSMLWLEATCLRVANKFACGSKNHIQSTCFKQWHSGVEGNEKVDGEAKDAAKGRTSQEHNLPSFLTTGKLPVSMSAM